MLSVAHRFAEIIGGKVISEKHDSFKIGVDRLDICPTLLDIPITPSHMFMVKCVSCEIALVYGEMALLETEVPVVASELLERNIIVSAIHNHWLCDRPRVMHLHFEVRMNPLDFAQKVVCLLP